MRFGLRAHDYGKHTPEELVGRVKADSFSAVQLAIPKAIQGIETFGDITEEHLQRIQQAFSQEDVEISVLGCYIEPSLLDATERQAQLATFLKALEYSVKLDAKLVGTETTPFRYDESDHKKVYDILVDSVLRMVEKAEKVGATVAIEPVADHTLATPELTYQLIEKVKSDRLKLIFDPVNMLCTDRVNQQDEVWKECIQAFGKHVEVMHIKDVILKDGQFSPVVLGTGIVDYTKIFEWVKKEKSHISLLREELHPATATLDRAFFEKHLG